MDVSGRDRDGHPLLEMEPGHEGLGTVDQGLAHDLVQGEDLVYRTS